MKEIFLFIMLLSFFKSNSQNNLYDYIVKKNNDTVYGAIQSEGLNKLVLIQKNNSNKSNGIKFYSHSLKKVKTLKYNGRIYQYKKSIDQEDPIYDNFIEKDTVNHTRRIGNFFNQSLKLEDFIVMSNNDTIYGKIIEPFIGKLYLINRLNKKYKISNKNIKSYRYHNDQYFDLNETKKKNTFLKLVTDGNVKLFVYEDYNPQYMREFGGPTKSQVYYIKKGDVIEPIGIIKFKKQMQKLFSDNNILIDKIMDEEFTFENLSLIVNFYNRTN